MGVSGAVVAGRGRGERVLVKLTRTLIMKRCNDIVMVAKIFRCALVWAGGSHARMEVAVVSVRRWSVGLGIISATWVAGGAHDEVAGHDGRTR